MISVNRSFFVQRLYHLLQTVSYTIATIVVLAFITAYRNNNAPFYTAETDYLHWETRLPAYSVCLATDGRYISQQLSKYTKSGSITAQNVSFFRNLLRPKKTYCAECPIEWPAGIETNIARLSNVLTPPCETQLTKCSFNNNPFTCCQYFRPIITKRGLCYSLNSDQTELFEENGLKLVSSILNSEANLKIEASASFSLHIHDHKTINMPNPKFIIPLGQTGTIYYKFSETLALDSAWELTRKQRRCILNGEMDISGYKHYSYTACRNKCLQQKQMSLCGCSHHFLPGENATCSTVGLSCLDKKSESLKKIKCKCFHRCTGLDIQFVYFKFKETDEKRKASVSVILTKPPTERTIMYAQTTLIETIVGFACLTRLITTANLYESLLAFCDMLSTYASVLCLFRKKNNNFIKEE